MYGLPGETLASWKEDLKQALALHPEHISAYHLIYEEGTTLWQLREQHKLEEADEDLSVSLFGTLIDSLTAAGYEHYEISNFCLPGFIPGTTPVIGLKRNIWAVSFRTFIQWYFTPMECSLTKRIYKRYF